MKIIYRHTEKIFEKLASVVTAVLGNSITFILALVTVILWLASKSFFAQDIHERVGDLISGFIFLSLFIIQKSFNRFSAALHIKVNELVVSHEPASNDVIDSENKTELELTALSKGYSEIVEKAKEKE